MRRGLLAAFAKVDEPPHKQTRALARMDECYGAYVKHCEEGRSRGETRTLSKPLQGSQEFEYSQKLSKGLFFRCQIKDGQDALKIIHHGKQREWEVIDVLHFPRQYRPSDGICPRPQIPPGLLHGPWSRDKGNMLELLHCPVQWSRIRTLLKASQPQSRSAARQLFFSLHLIRTSRRRCTEGLVT